MAITKTESGLVFDLTKIARGYFIRAKHKSWDEARNGLVFRATKEALTVQYLPPVHSTTCYYNILAAEISDNEWALIKVSADFSAITTEVEVV